MESNFDCWEMTGLIFVTIVGTLLHFVYKWAKQNKVAGLVSPVNESVWEHLKLLFVPMLLFSIVEYFAIGNQFPNFIAAKVTSIVFGMLTILVVFYTYSGIAGRHFLWADILTFFLGVAAAYAYGRRIIICQADAGTVSQCMAIMIALVLVVSFAVFTFYPPHVPLFLDPVSKTYGAPEKTPDHPK